MHWLLVLQHCLAAVVRHAPHAHRVVVPATGQQAAGQDSQGIHHTVAAMLQGEAATAGGLPQAHLAAIAATGQAPTFKGCQGKHLHVVRELGDGVGGVGEVPHAHCFTTRCQAAIREQGQRIHAVPVLLQGVQELARGSSPKAHGAICAARCHPVAREDCHAQDRPRVPSVPADELARGSVPH